MVERRDSHKRSYETSEGEMLADILKLSLKLLLKLLVRLCKFIAKGLALLFYLFKLGIQRIIDFWNDNNTQQKLRIAKKWCRNAIRLLSMWLVLCLRFFVKIGVWTAKAIGHGLLNLKPSLVMLGNLIVRFAHAMWKLCIALGRRVKLFFVHRKRAYAAFRKNKGFRGLMIDTKNYLQHLLNDYMDEDQGEADSNSMSYEEYIKEVRSEKNDSNTLGKRIYQSMKNIIDSD